LRAAETGEAAAKELAIHDFQAEPDELPPQIPSRRSPSADRTTGAVRPGPGCWTRRAWTARSRSTRAVEANLEGLFFASTMANLASRVLAYACGSETQAVALMDNRLVRNLRPSCGVTAQARARPGLVPAVRPRPVPVPRALSGRRSRCWRAVRLAVPRCAAPPDPPVLAARRAALPGHPARVHSPGSSAAQAWERTAGSCPGCAVTAGAPRRC